MNKFSRLPKRELPLSMILNLPQTMGKPVGSNVCRRSAPDRPAGWRHRAVFWICSIHCSTVRTWSRRSDRLALEFVSVTHSDWRPRACCSPTAGCVTSNEMTDDWTTNADGCLRSNCSCCSESDLVRWSGAVSGSSARRSRPNCSQ